MRSEIITIIKSSLIREFPNIIIAQKKNIIEDQLREGDWPDLSSAYKKQKASEYGFVYPMLKASGELMNSFVVEISEQDESLEFTVTNSVEYFNTVDKERNISSFTQEDMDELTVAVAAIIEQALQGVEDVV